MGEELATVTPPKWQRRLRRALPWVALLVLFVGMRAWQTRGVVSGTAPAVAGRALDGSPVSLAELRGRPVLVHFWASWCGVCDLMAGNVAALAKDHAVVTVASWSGSPGDLHEHVGGRFPAASVVPDPDGRLARAYGVTAVPASFIVSPAGEIHHVEVGYTTELGLRARLWLASW